VGGIATNFGVESTARDAWGAQLSADPGRRRHGEAHQFAVHRIFPRLGRVCAVADVLAAWAGSAGPVPATASRREPATGQ
jgi:nicotinamidase-related amidase